MCLGVAILLPTFFAVHAILAKFPKSFSTKLMAKRSAKKVKFWSAKVLQKTKNIFGVRTDKQTNKQTPY